MTEPVSLAEIKRHLVLDPADGSEDEDLSAMITGARRALELKTRRSIVGEDRVSVLPSFPAMAGKSGWFSSSPAALLQGAADIELPGGTVTAVEVNYYAADGTDTTLDAGEYYAAIAQVPALLRPVNDWPGTQDRPDAVRIAYTVSPLAAADLMLAKQAVKLIVGHWHANREAVSPDGRAGMAELPMAVSWIIDALRVFASD